jgi:general secretion pathway protein A
LVTGEPGAGKTWLSRQLVAELPAGWQSSYVALTSSLDAIDFLALAGDELGVAQSNRISAARLGIEAALRDEQSDDRNWILIVDDAQRAARDVWDEIQVQGDRVGRPGAFAALLVLSQTEFIRLSATRSFRSFAVSISEHYHLAPMDLDEARQLLGLSARVHEHESLVLEEVHRDAAGNPRRLLQLVETRPVVLRARSDDSNGATGPIIPAASGLSYELSVSLPRRDHTPQESTNENGTPEPKATFDGPAKRTGIVAESSILDEKRSAVSSIAQSPPLIAAKPPIRIEEGMVEVGWEGDLAAEYVGPEGLLSPSPRTAGAVTTMDETVVEDHYAALQAWTERSSNRQRTIAETGLGGDLPPSAEAEPEHPGDPSFANEPDDAEILDPPSLARIRAEGQHDFAPYSQLFTRLRQSQ